MSTTEAPTTAHTKAQQAPRKAQPIRLVASPYKVDSIQWRDQLDQGLTLPEALRYYQAKAQALQAKADMVTRHGRACYRAAMLAQARVDTLQGLLVKGY